MWWRSRIPDCDAHSYMSSPTLHGTHLTELGNASAMIRSKGDPTHAVDVTEFIRPSTWFITRGSPTQSSSTIGRAGLY